MNKNIFNTVYRIIPLDLVADILFCCDILSSACIRLSSINIVHKWTIYQSGLLKCVHTPACKLRNEKCSLYANTWKWDWVSIGSLNGFPIVHRRIIQPMSNSLKRIEINMNQYMGDLYFNISSVRWNSFQIGFSYIFACISVWVTPVVTYTRDLCR